MQIKNIKWKNFQSYGNIWSELIFDSTSSLNLITGDNGTGKTTILQAIIFALTGKTILGKNLDTLVNRKNKNLETEINILNNNNKFKIIRNLKPSKFEVYCNEEFVQEPDKANLQKYVDDNILNNITNKMLQNLLMINISNYTSIFEMKNKEAVNFFMDILELTEFDKILELVNVDINNTNKIINELTIEKYSLQSKIDTINSLLENELQYNQNDEKVSELKHLNKKSEEIEEQIEKQKQKIENDNLFEIGKQLEQKNDIASQKIAEYNNKLRDIEYKKQTIQNDIKNYNKHIKLLKSGKCNFCESDLNSDFHINKIQQYEKQIEDLNNVLTGFDNDIDLTTVKINDIKIKQSKLQLKTKQILKQIDEANNTLSRLINEKFNNDKHIQIVKDFLEKSKQDNKEKVNKIKEELYSVNEKLNITTNSFITQKNELKKFNDIYNIFDKNSTSDKNIISYIMKILTNVLQNEINDLLIEFDKNFKISIDEKLNIKILSSEYENDYNINNLSSGEKRFLEICFLLVLISLIKGTNKSMNIIFLDEIFTCLDQNSFYGIIDMLKTVANEKKLHIFVIHHGIMENGSFNNIYSTKKLNGYSEISLS